MVGENLDVPPAKVATPPGQAECVASHVMSLSQVVSQDCRKLKLPLDPVNQLIGSAFREQHPLMDHRFQIPLERSAVDVRT